MCENKCSEIIHSVIMNSVVEENDNRSINMNISIKIKASTDRAQNLQNRINFL